MAIQLNKTNGDWQYQSGSFSGPIDLLLQLVKDAKIEIKDIFVSEVTYQYLDYIHNIPELDMDQASGFLDVAATLLEMKSLSLLPKLEEEDQEVVDEGALLISRMEELQLLQKAGERLKQNENVNRFYRAPDDKVGNERIILTTFVLDDMLDAYARILTKADQKRKDAEQPKQVQRERFTLPEKIHFLKVSLEENKELLFSELFDEESTKQEYITTFQALLEIMKEQFATADQQQLFEEIEIKLREMQENEEENNG
ncbi:MAG: segregation/condensation protein A [Clostridia bacterium]|nr:segregation/condensation protein A [Clostridia bacterium]